MRLLLDTHFLYWLLLEPDTIRPDEHRLLFYSDNDILVSPVSLWEVRLKWQRRDREGRRKGLLNPDEVLAYLAHQSMNVPALEAGDCAGSLAPPLSHGDPFDEMLLIHASRLGARLFTRDRMLLEHPIAYRPA